MAARPPELILRGQLLPHEEDIVEQMLLDRLEALPIPGLDSFSHPGTSPLIFSTQCEGNVSLGFQQLMTDNYLKHGRRILTPQDLENMGTWTVSGPTEVTIHEDLLPISIVHLQGKLSALPGHCVPGGMCIDGPPHETVEEPIRIQFPSQSHQRPFVQSILWKLAPPSHNHFLIVQLQEEGFRFHDHPMVWKSQAAIMKEDGDVVDVVDETSVQQVVIIDALDDIGLHLLRGTPGHL